MRTNNSSGSRSSSRNSKTNKKRANNNKKKFIKKKICLFCTEKKDMFDYKDIEQLSQYLTERGKIVPRKMSGNCAKHQRAMAEVIKRSRHAGLMPFVTTT